MTLFGATGAEALERILMLTAAAGTAWYIGRVLVALLLVMAAGTVPGCRRLAVRCAPAALRPMVRRAVAGGLLTTALASPAWAASGPGCPADDGIPLLDRAPRCEPATSPADLPSGTDTGARPDPGGQGSAYEVQPGDSLWQIAASHVGQPADQAAVAAAWPMLWQANRDVIGPDPGMILPGTQLVIPAALAQEAK